MQFIKSTSNCAKQILLEPNLLHWNVFMFAPYVLRRVLVLLTRFHYVSLAILDSLCRWGGSKLPLPPECWGQRHAAGCTWFSCTLHKFLGALLTEDFNDFLRNLSLTWEWSSKTWSYRNVGGCDSPSWIKACQGWQCPPLPESLQYLPRFFCTGGFLDDPLRPS